MEAQVDRRDSIKDFQQLPYVVFEILWKEGKFLFFVLEPLH